MAISAPPFLSMYMSDPYNLLVVLPLACGYIMGSFTGLRKWIAIQQVPAPTSSVPTTSQANAAATVNAAAVTVRTDAAVTVRTKITIAAVGCFIVVVGCFICFLYFKLVFALLAAARRYGLDDLLLFCIYIPPFFDVNIRACDEWFGMPLTWHRTLKGSARSVATKTEITKTKKFVRTILGIGLPVGAIWYRSCICASAILFVVVLVFTGKQAGKTNSLRKVIINAIVAEVLIPSFLGITFAIIAYTRDKQGDDKQENNPAMEICVFAIFAAVPLSRLFATALRFDFANYVEATQSSTPIITVETVPAPVAKAPDGQLTAGVKAPPYWAVLSVPFKLCYFSAVLVAWTAAHFITHVLIEQRLFYVHSLCALLLSIPLMVAALVTVAFFRGEAKKMWNYKEVWAVEPVAGEAAVAVDTGAATHEDVKEKYDDLASA